MKNRNQFLTLALAAILSFQAGQAMDPDRLAQKENQEQQSVEQNSRQNVPSLKDICLETLVKKYSLAGSSYPKLQEFCNTNGLPADLLQDLAAQAMTWQDYPALVKKYLAEDNAFKPIKLAWGERFFAQSKTSDFFATISGNRKKVQFFDYDGTLLKTFDYDNNAVLTSLDFSPCGQYMLIANRDKIEVRDMDNNLVKDITPSTHITPEYAGGRWGYKALFSPAGASIFIYFSSSPNCSGYRGELRPFDPQDTNSLDQITKIIGLGNNEGSFKPVKFSPCGEFIAVCSSNYIIKLFSTTDDNIQPCKVFYNNGVPFSIDFARNGKLLATTSYRCLAELFDTTDQANQDISSTDPQITSMLQAKHTNKDILSVAFSPCGQYFATADWGSDNDDEEGDEEDNECTIIYNINIWSNTCKLLARIPLDKQVKHLAFSPCGKFIFALDDDCKVRRIPTLTYFKTTPIKPTITDEIKETIAELVSSLRNLVIPNNKTQSRD
ncbi:MAG: WD40 repeat domain-containing protein [Epsilonproteobacteria bacterium]|nr:WD40 repeat domain-containing protein [Campylobacterota bacterium]